MFNHAIFRLVIKILFFIVTIFFHFPDFLFVTPTVGIDASWQISLHLATQNNLVFGKDFIFTYGPLGVLITRLPIHLSIFALILYDLLILVNLLYVVNYAIQKCESWWQYLLLIVLILVNRNYTGADSPFILTIFLITHLFIFLQTQRLFNLFLALLLSLGLFYLKLNTGIIALFMFVSSISYAYFTQKLKLNWLLISLGVYCFFILSCTYLLNVNLSEYFIASLHLIAGFNDAMYLAPFDIYLNFWHHAVYILGTLIIIGIIFLLSLRNLKNLREHLDDLFVLFLIALLIFVLFKQGFVRADGHSFVFFKFISGVIGLILLFAQDRFLKKLILLPLGLALTSSIINLESYQIFTNYNYTYRTQQIINYINNTFSPIPATNFGSPTIPKEVFDLVNNKTVDIIPSEISLLYFNRLKYSPRPIIQSYSAYDEYLDNKNKEKYQSNTAPDFIFFSIGIIDNRYSFFDESMTKLAILENYDVVKSFGDNLLLKKRVQKRTLNSEKTIIQSGKLGENIPIPINFDLLKAKISIKHSFLGSLQRLLYQPPPLFIVLQLENGKEFKFRAIIPILEGGVLINKFVNNVDEARLFFETQGLSNLNIISFRIEGKDKSTFGYQNEIKISYEEIKTSNILPKNIKPVKIKLVQKSETDTYLKLKVYVENNLLNKNEFLKLILQSPQKNYLLPTNPIIDTTIQDKEKVQLINVDIAKSLLINGNYKIGFIASENLLMSSEVINYDNRKLLKINQLPKASENIVLAIDAYDDFQNFANISGWTHIKGQGMETSTIKLVLIGDVNNFVMKTELLNRNDVTQYFKTYNLDRAGYRAEIPKLELPSGTYRIGVLIEDTLKKKRELIITNKIIKNYTFKIQKNPKLPPTQDSIQYDIAVEGLEKNQTSYIVTGWATIIGQGAENSTIWLVLYTNKTNYLIKTDVINRNDVTKYFKTYNFDRAGYYAEIPKSKLPKGIYKLGIYIKDAKNNEEQFRLTDKVINHK